MNLDPRSISGRMMSLGLLALLAAICWVSVFSPMADAWRAKADMVDLLETRYEKLLGLIERGNPAETERLTDAPKAIASGSRASAQTVLQSEVRKIALMHQVNLRSITAADLSDDDSETVSIIVSAESSLKSLVRMIYHLETSGQAIWTRDLALRGSTRGGGQSDTVRLQVNFAADALWYPFEEDAEG